MRLARRGFERFLRKLLKLPSKPALHYLHVYQPFYQGDEFWPSAEAEMETILQYYSIPTVSARNALYTLMSEEVQGFSQAEISCGFHPNPLGHRCVQCACCAITCKRGSDCLDHWDSGRCSVVS